MSDRSHFEENDSSITWEQTFITTFNALKRPIEKYIQQLALSHAYSVDAVRNEIFLLFTKSIDSGRIEYLTIESHPFFIYVKLDGSKEEIQNFKAWLRKISFNYLKKLRSKQNKHDNVLDIDSYSAYSSENILDYIMGTELRQKLQALKDEDRRILEMVYFEKLNYKQISACWLLEGFGKQNETALRKKKERALEKLRILYSK